MDDLLTGSGNIEEAKRMKDEISKILESGGLILLKWSWNRNDLLIHDEDDRQNN